MSYYAINHDNHTINIFDTLDQAKIYCSLALKVSKSLCVFYHTKKEFFKLDIDISKFKVVLK